MTHINGGTARSSSLAVATLAAVLSLLAASGAAPARAQSRGADAIGGDRAAADPATKSDPRDFSLPPAAAEIAASRSATTTRFRVRDGEGRGRFAEVATGRTMHYVDGAGKLVRASGEIGDVPFAAKSRLVGGSA